MKKQLAKTRGGVADDYLELVKRFPLRPIRSDAEYTRAIEIQRSLLMRADSPGLSDGEGDYLEAIARFLKEYDEVHYSIGASELTTPIARLKYLMEQSGMKTTELGELLGSGSGQASLILNGKRELSKANIRALVDRFKVNAGAFL